MGCRCWELLPWAISPSTGEQINALWIVVASVCIYLIVYRFYGRYIAKTVLAVDGTRMTPAVRHNDGAGLRSDR